MKWRGLVFLAVLVVCSNGARACDLAQIEGEYNRGNMALHHFYDNGMQKKDAKEAIEFLLKAAKHGHVLAQLRLADAYREGVNGTNKKEMMKWYRKAAEQGNAEAERQLGWELYMNQNYKSAVQWFLKAAELGDVYAQLSLGRAYDIGEGVGKDSKEAAKWYQRAVDQGNTNVDAREFLGRYRGVGKDKVYNE